MPHSTVGPTRIRALQAAIAPAYALLAGIELDLFSELGDEALAGQEIARRLGVASDRVERLLYALVVAGLLEHRAGHFFNGAEARQFLIRNRPCYVGGDYPLVAQLWRADLHTAASIREARPTAFHDFAAGDASGAAEFFRGLVPSARAFGLAISDLVDWTGVRSVIDIGGGPGSALTGIGERHPGLRRTLLELPASLELAKPLLAEAGDHDVVFEAGDIVAAPSSMRHDVALLKAVIQVLSRTDAELALHNAYESLESRGLLCVTGAGILNDDRMSPIDAVYYNLTFMNLYAGGESYTRSEYSSWLSRVGFVDLTYRALPSGSTLLTGRKP
jgi:hypothetical protein